jgi:DNA-binding transcriptional MerR regulator
MTDDPQSEYESPAPDYGAPQYNSPDETDAPSQPVTISAPRPIAAREYYAISEVCDLVGLKPHVLRYWETQFPVLNPSKNRSGNRVYQRKEIKLILLVKHLLYKEKYTIDGAKQRLAELRKGGELATETSRALDAQMIELLRAELQQALLFLTPDPV